MFTVQTAVKSGGARQQVRPLLRTLSTACAASSIFPSKTISHDTFHTSVVRPTAPAPLIPCVASTLMTARRFGSGLRRKASSGRGRGKGREVKGRGTTTAAKAGESDMRPALFTGNHRNGKTADNSLTEAEDGFDSPAAAAAAAPLGAPLTLRHRRSERARASAEAAVLRGASSSIEQLVEEELKAAETPAEDPTASTPEEDAEDEGATGDNDEDLNGGVGGGGALSRRGRRSDGFNLAQDDETRVDGVAESSDDVEAFQDAGMEEEEEGQSTSRKGRRSKKSAEEELSQDEAATAEDGEGDDGSRKDVRRSFAADDDEDREAQRENGGFSAASVEHDEETANRFLAVAFPDLAAEYAAAGADANKVPVADVKVDSAEVAAWRCPSCAATWQCGVFVRCILKNTCPHCAAAHAATLAVVRPDLVQLWDFNRNNPFLSPETIAAESREVVYWNCPTCRESYKGRVRDRVHEKVRCPSCALLRSTSTDALSAAANALQQEWHPLKNGDLRLDQLTPMDRKTRVWWLCASCGHEWEASLATRLSHSQRSRGRVCPACKGKGAMQVY